MRFNRAIRLMRDALQTGNGQTVAQCVSNSGVSRGVLPVLFVLQATPEFSTRRLVDEFLAELRAEYNLVEAIGQEDDRDDPDSPFYESNQSITVDLNDAGLTNAVIGLILDPQNYAIANILRDLDISAESAQRYIQRLTLLPAQRANVLARMQTEEAFIVSVEQDLLARMEPPRERLVQYLNQWVNASFSPYDNLATLIRLPGTLQPWIFYFVAIVCVFKSASSDENMVITFGLAGIMLVASVIKASCKPPELERIRRFPSAQGAPLDVYYWITPRLLRRYRPDSSVVLRCVFLGLATDLLILWYALQAFPKGTVSF